MTTLEREYATNSREIAKRSREDLKAARCHCGAAATEIAIDRRSDPPTKIARCAKHREARRLTLAEARLRLDLLEAR